MQVSVYRNEEGKLMLDLMTLDQPRRLEIPEDQLGEASEEKPLTLAFPSLGPNAEFTKPLGESPLVMQIAAQRFDAEALQEQGEDADVRSSGGLKKEEEVSYPDVTPGKRAPAGSGRDAILTDSPSRQEEERIMGSDQTGPQPGETAEQKKRREEQQEQERKKQEEDRKNKSGGGQGGQRR